jgi:urease accessory protein
LYLGVNTTERGAALLTTPGATKFYRTNGKVACQDQVFRIDQDCTLEWLPQETIYFPDANAQLHTTVHLLGNARFIGWEIHCLGLPASEKDFGEGQADIGISIYRDDRPILLEKMFIDPKKRALQAAFLRNQPVFGSCIATGCDKDILDDVRDAIPQEGEGVCGVTLIDDLLIVRYAGPSTIEARKYFTRAWRSIRPQVMSRQSCLPRIWAT